MTINARQKGARGERELALLLADNGFPAKRGVQFSQGKHGLTGADVECESLDFMHIECKRTETLSIYKALAQAIRDSRGKIPVVFHKRNHSEWVVILEAGHFLDIIRRSDLVKEIESEEIDRAY